MVRSLQIGSGQKENDRVEYGRHLFLTTTRSSYAIRAHVKQVEVTCHLMRGDFFKKYVYTLL